MSSYSSALQIKRKAVNSAFQLGKEFRGEEMDEDLVLYERLTDYDFKLITRQYGVDNVTRYIQTMEARRLKRRR